MFELLRRAEPVLDATLLLEAATILRGMLKRARESRGDFRVFLNVQLRRLTTSASAAEEASSTVGNGEAVSERRTSEKNVGGRSAHTRSA